MDGLALLHNDIVLIIYRLIHNDVYIKVQDQFNLKYTPLWDDREGFGYVGVFSTGTPCRTILASWRKSGMHGNMIYDMLNPNTYYGSIYIPRQSIRGGTNGCLPYNY